MSLPIDTLAYARALRDAGFSEQQAEGQASALAAAMTDALATKQDLRELESRMDAKFEVRFGRVDSRFAQVEARLEHLDRHLDTRLAEQERRTEIRFREQGARFEGGLADLERRMTMRLGTMMVAGIGTVSVLVRLL